MKRERSVPLTLDDRLFAQTKSTSLETPMDGTCGAQRVLSRPGLGFFGDYEILGKLGHGGMGVVYRARHIKLNQVVALKMIRSGGQTTTAAVRQLQNEADALAELDHPRIVPIYEVGNHLGQHFFTMKLFEGGDLAGRLISFRENPYAAARLVAQLADAIHHAHLRGILHCDLKPANILIDGAGHPYVADFGIAQRIHSLANQTQASMILGTPPYLSPEQAARKRGSMTTAIDIYGLGVILYEVLIGQPPFTGDSLGELLGKIKKQPPEMLCKQNEKIPRDLEMICLKCLAKTPQNRYAQAIGLAEDLRQFAKHHQVVQRRMGSPETWLPECSDQSALTLLPTCQRVLATQSPSARPNLSESQDLSDYPANRSSVVPAGRFREGK